MSEVCSGDSISKFANNEFKLSYFRNKFKNEKCKILKVFSENKTNKTKKENEDFYCCGKSLNDTDILV